MDYNTLHLGPWIVMPCMNSTLNILKALYSYILLHARNLE